MIRAAALILIALGVFGQGAPIEVICGSTINETFPALRDGAQSRVELRRFQLRHTRDVKTVSELILFRDPATGLSLGMVRYLKYGFLFIDAKAGDSLPNAAVSIDGGVMRGFFFADVSLLISESTARDASLDAAQERVLAEYGAADAAMRAISKWWVTDQHWIRLHERLPKEFTKAYSEPRSRWPATRLRHLTRTGRCWSMLIEGPDSESLPVIVAESYDLVGKEICAKSGPPAAHVVFSPTATTLRVPALRNNRPTTMEVLSTFAETTFPDGPRGRINVLMLYDPRTRLFWWTAHVDDFRTRDLYVQNLIHSSSVFVADDRIAVFADGTVAESTTRFPDLRSAKAHLVSVLERIRGNLQAHRGGLPIQRLDTGIPGAFFYACGSSIIDLPELRQVERIGRHWRLRYSGANGNFAVVDLKENFERANVQLTGEYGCGPGFPVR